MDDKFMGLGLKNIFGLTLIVIVMIVLLKVVLAKYPIKGASELMHAV